MLFFGVASAESTTIIFLQYEWTNENMKLSRQNLENRSKKRVNSKVGWENCKEISQNISKDISGIFPGHFI